MLFALVRSSALSRIGVALPPNRLPLPGWRRSARCCPANGCGNPHPKPAQRAAGTPLSITETRDASRVGKPHFLGVDRRVLCLLGIGALQFVAGRARIPEVSAKEPALCRVVFEHREVR